jgi:hypothetical protein
MQLLRAGLIEGGMAPSAIEEARAEAAAVARALELLRERDLVVVLAVDVPAVLAQLRPLEEGG